MLIRNITSRSDLEKKKELQEKLLGIQIDNERIQAQRITDYHNPNKPPPLPLQYKSPMDILQDSITQQKEVIQNLRDIGVDFLVASQFSQDLLQKTGGIANLNKFNKFFPKIKKDFSEKFKSGLITVVELNEYWDTFDQEVENAVVYNGPDTTNIFNRRGGDKFNIIAPKESYINLIAEIDKTFTNYPDLESLNLKDELEILKDSSPTSLELEKIGSLTIIDQGRVNDKMSRLINTYKIPTQFLINEKIEKLTNLLNKINKDNIATYLPDLKDTLKGIANLISLSANSKNMLVRFVLSLKESISEEYNPNQSYSDNKTQIISKGRKPDTPEQILEKIREIETKIGEFKKKKTKGKLTEKEINALKNLNSSLKSLKNKLEERKNVGEEAFSSNVGEESSVSISGISSSNVNEGPSGAGGGGKRVSVYPPTSNLSKKEDIITKGKKKEIEELLDSEKIQYENAEKKIRDILKDEASIQMTTNKNEKIKNYYATLSSLYEDIDKEDLYSEDINKEQQYRNANEEGRAKLSYVLKQELPSAKSERKKEIKNLLKMYEDIDRETSGVGIKVQGKKYIQRKIKIGKGLEIKDDQPRFKTFGKFLIHIPFLENESILNVRYPSTGVNPNIKPVKIDSNFKEFINDVLDSGRVNQRHWETLTEPEKDHFIKISRGAGLLNKFNIKADDDSKEKKDLFRLDLLYGEFIAGNDNPQMIKEAKSLIKKYLATGALNRGKGLEMLINYG